VTALFARRYFAWPLLCVLIGCGARSETTPPMHAAPAEHGRATVTVSIRIPKATSAAITRRPRYVSPATQSMTLLVTQQSGGATVVSQTVGLTPTSTGCASTLASTECTLTIALAAGSYVASLSTYDGANGTGNELSAAQQVDFTVAQGQANALNLTLSGVPASLQVASTASAVHGSQSAGFTLYGVAAQKLLVEALDADGDVIVGPGSPTFTVASASGSGFGITNPTTSAPNTFSLAPPGTNGQGETFTATAAYADSTCSTSGAVCSTTFAVKNDVQTLFVANYDPSDTVTVYNPPYTNAPTATISNGVSFPDALAVDTARDVFVANANTVTEYAPPYTSAPSVTISNGVSYPAALVFDAHGNLFVANAGAGTVTIYAPPYSGAPTTIAGFDVPAAMALDGQGDLFVADLVMNQVTEYAPPYTGAPIATIADVNMNSPIAVVLDPTGDLFVANNSDSLVVEYAPPYTAASAVVVDAVSAPNSLLLDGADNLYVGNGGANTVTEYAPPYANPPIATLGTGLTPVSIVFDGADDLFASNSGGTSVDEFTPPFTAAPAVISNGVNLPLAAALTP
jgi:hypothetical protein